MADVYLYVSSDYNSSTEGWGVTKFNNWDSAFSYAGGTGVSEKIIFEKTKTISGNCLPATTASSVSEIIIQEGATVGNANSKWDLTTALTIKAGGILQSARPASAGYGYTHVKNILTIGEADAEKKAYVNWINGNGMTYKTMCLSVLYNGTMIANNAEINVGDFGSVGKSEITDSTMNIAGSICFGANLSQTSTPSTLVNSTVKVVGHDLRGDNTYSAADKNVISNLNMNNSTIIIDDGNNSTVADVVELGRVNTSGWIKSKKPLTMTNNSLIQIEKGTQVNAIWDVSMTDSKIDAGNLSVVDGTFTMLGKSVLDIAELNIAEGKKLAIDNTASITASALTGAGIIEINIVDEFKGIDQVIDLGGKATADMLAKITVKQDGYSVMIHEGDIYVATPVYAVGANAETPAGVPEEDIFASLDDAIESKRMVVISGKFEIDADAAALLNAGSNIQFAENTLFLLGEGVTLDIADDNLTVKDTARALTVNANYLSTLFHRDMGMTFIDFVNRERTNQAASLLRHTNLQIQQIAATVGYNNTSYFAKQFVRFQGISPSQYRRETTKTRPGNN